MDTMEAGDVKVAATATDVVGVMDDKLLEIGSDTDEISRVFVAKKTSNFSTNI